MCKTAIANEATDLINELKREADNNLKVTQFKTKGEEIPGPRELGGRDFGQLQLNRAPIYRCELDEVNVPERSAVCAVYGNGP